MPPKWLNYGGRETGTALGNIRSEANSSLLHQRAVLPPRDSPLSPRLPPSGFNVFGNVSDFHSYPGGGIISKFRLNLVHRKRHLFAIHLFGRNGIVNLALREILRIGSKRVSENERMHFESEGFVNYLRLIL